jgi:hypothetical protein
MKRTVRTLAAAMTAATLTLTGTAYTAAAAKPIHAGAHVKGGKGAVASSDVRKVVRDIERVKAQIGRAVSDRRIGGLADAASIGANAGLDLADLEALQSAATAADTTLDLKQVRRDVRSYRVENYRLVVNVLRHAAEVGAAATDVGNAEAQTLVASAVTTALTIRATSVKALLQDARADLEVAEELLDAENTEADETDAEDDIEETQPVTTPTEA